MTPSHLYPVQLYGAVDGSFKLNFQKANPKKLPRTLTIQSMLLILSVRTMKKMSRGRHSCRM